MWFRGGWMMGRMSGRDRRNRLIRRRVAAGVGRVDGRRPGECAGVGVARPGGAGAGDAGNYPATDQGGPGGAGSWGSWCAIGCMGCGTIRGFDRG